MVPRTAEELTGSQPGTGRGLQTAQSKRVGRPSPLTALLRRSRGLAGHPRGRDGADLTATISRRRVSSEPDSVFRRKIRRQSELLPVPPAPILSAPGTSLLPTAAWRQRTGGGLKCKCVNTVPADSPQPSRLPGLFLFQFSVFSQLRGVQSFLTCLLDFCDAESRINTRWGRQYRTT